MNAALRGGDTSLDRVVLHAYFSDMSTTTLHIIELVKSLPVEEQRAICAGLNRQVAGLEKIQRPQFIRTPGGGCYNPDGIPNDDPFFKIMEQIEEERHRTPGRALPEFE
jgi:hypothetical protein